ncbi:MAG: hemerythrin family protein [Anaeromyxobacteraceae bacterium]
MTHVHGPVLDHPDLDAPHADLLARAAELAEAVRARQDRKAATLVDGLLTAAAQHFATEEELMDRTAYPDRVAHRTSHDLFLQDLHGSVREVAVHGVSPRVIEWATGRLQEWLRFHMEQNDRPLAAHLRRVALQRGVHPAPRRS